jgi:hypothetical protein
LTAGWTFTPSMSFGTLWDSNVTVVSEGNPEVGETVFLLNPRGEIDFNGRRTRFNVGYSGSLEAYQELEELQRYDQRGRLEAKHQMTPRLTFVTRHSLTMSPTTDSLELNGLLFERVGSKMLNAKGGFEYGLAPRTTLAGDYTFQWVRFERDPSEQRFAFLRGGHMHTPSARVTHRLTPRFGVGGSWQYRHAIIGGGEEIVDVHDAMAEVSYQITRNTTIAGGAGVAHLKPSGNETAQTGPSFRAGVSHHIEQVTFGASFERSFLPSFGFAGTTVNEVLNASVRVPLLGGRMFWTGGLAYRRSEPLAIRTDVLELDSWWSQTAFGFTVFRWLRMEAFYNGSHQTSSARGRVDRTRVGVQFVTFKPVRIQ